MIILSQEVARLPLHDATVLDLTFPSLQDGFDTISFRLRLNPEERSDQLRAFKIEGAEFSLTFEGCLQITARLVGVCSGKELIASLDVMDRSEIRERLGDYPLNIESSNVNHFRIEGSHGSWFDIIAEKVLIRP
jgi:hypothetical protein